MSLQDIPQLTREEDHEILEILLLEENLNLNLKSLFGLSVCEWQSWVHKGVNKGRKPYPGSSIMLASTYCA